MRHKKKSGLSIAPPGSSYVSALWREYCETTYLPGFHYLVEDRPILHKLFWLCVCVVFSILTLYQIIGLFLSYASNPIKTTVSKTYLDSLIFPQVSICNTMPFRVSQVRPVSDMHKALNKIYKTSSLNVTAAKQNDTYATLSQIKNPNWYFRNVAHQAEDFIIGCRWQGKPCSSANFTEAVTEQGICYSFNSDSDHPLSVTHYGKNYGLELVLNIARYEEMNGPYKVYGATVSVSPQGYPVTTMSATTALVGSYTTISLMQKEINFLEGSTCGSLPLQFFEHYTMESCHLEKTYQQINSTCGCYPYMINTLNSSQSWNGSQICDLAQHFSCAQFYIDNPVNVTDDDCPTACKNFIHSTTVSVAQVAWERMEGNIPNLEKTMKKIGEQLRNAFEVTTRYHPRYADPKMQLLRRVESTHEEMSKLIETLNSLNLTLPVIPPSVGAHTLLKNFRKFIRSTFEPNVDIIEAALHGMNESFVDGERAFANQTIASLLFGNSSTTIRSLKSLNLPEKVFNLINGRLYMNTFSSFCKNLERVKFGRDHILSEWREGFYVLNGKTIIVGNATDLINRSIDQLMLLIFKKIEYERYGVHGCMQSPMRQFNLTKYASRLSENDNLFDSYLCFNRLFASPNSVASLANQMAHFSEVVPINAVDSDQQTEICNDLLCRVFDDPLNCTITPEEKIKIGIMMRSIMPKAFQQCQLAINEARDTFTALSDIYINKILPDYAKMVDLAAGFTANDKKIREMFNRPLWIVTQERQSLVEDVRGYINGSANFSELANAIVTNYSIWLDQNFNFNSNNAKRQLTETLITMASMEKQLLEFLEFKTRAEKLDPNNTANGHGIFNVLSQTVLWGNETADNIKLILALIHSLKAKIPPVLEKLETRSKKFGTAMRELIEDCKWSVTQITINPDFYSKNFMVVNVIMQEMSYEVITQQTAAEFWSLIADLGGAGSFWLGIHLATFVQIIDFCCRFCFKSCWKGVKKTISQGKLSQPSTNTLSS